MTEYNENKFSSNDFALLSVLADPTRRAIFNLLLEKPKPVKVIAADMPISQAAVSQHLKIMKAANLVLDEKQGRYHVFSTNPRALDWLSWQFGAMRDDALGSIEKHLPAPQSIAGDHDAVDNLMEDWTVAWPEQDPLALGVIVRMRLIANYLQRLAEKSAERFQLNIAQVQLLATLDRLSPADVPLEEISKITFLSFSATERHFEYLVKGGLIEMHRDDSGHELIRLTDSGRDTVHAVFLSQRENEHASIYRRSNDDLLSLTKLLRPIFNELRQRISQDNT